MGAVLATHLLRGKHSNLLVFDMYSCSHQMWLVDINQEIIQVNVDISYNDCNLHLGIVG
jgi:hypothetical protein